MCRLPAAANTKTGRGGRLLGAGDTHGAGRWTVGQGTHFRLGPPSIGWHTRVARPEETPHRRNRSRRRLADVNARREPPGRFRRGAAPAGPRTDLLSAVPVTGYAKSRSDSKLPTTNRRRRAGGHDGATLRF